MKVRILFACGCRRTFACAHHRIDGDVACWCGGGDFSPSLPVHIGHVVGGSVKLLFGVNGRQKAFGGSIKV